MELRGGFYLRLALIADLWIYLITLILFVLLPIFPVALGQRLDGNEITGVEWFIASLGLIPLYTLLGRLFRKPHVPLNEWAYLITSFYGLFVLIAFLTVGIESVIVEYTVRIIIIFVSLIGIAGATGAHILDGGKGPPLGPRLEKFLSERDE